jgi:gamma-glutamyltranspeptidase/glutathione hydrolase
VPVVTPDVEVEFTTRPVIRGTRGVVAAGHYVAAALGMHVLESGGNAVDAGVAAGFALNLLKPHDNGIGGEAPILIHAGSRSGGRVVAISGQGTAPRLATVERFVELGLAGIPGDGLLPATVPAAFGAWVTAQARFGRLTLAETLGPVVDLARDGFVMYPYLRAVIARYRDRFLEEWPSTAETYLDGEDVPSVGSVLRLPVWAATMGDVLDSSVRAGRTDRDSGFRAALDRFYRGPVAEAIDAFASTTEVLDASGRRHQGLLRREDLATYGTRVEAALTVEHHGLTVHKCGPWTQGPVFLQQLRLLEGFDLEAMGHNSADYIHTVVECAKLAFADREAFYGDPDFSDVPLDRLLSSAYADERRRLVDPASASLALRPGGGDALAADIGAGEGGYVGDTTHVDAVDADGLMLSATPSGGWIPSSPVVPSLGFPLGTRGQQFNLKAGHPNCLAPGKRPRATLTPSLATRDGRPHMVFGTPGGDAQDQWTLQFFLAAERFGMDLQAAIDAPTFHSEHVPDSFYPHAYAPGGLLVEGRVPADVIAELRRRGHAVTVTDGWLNGQVSAVRIDPDTGVIEGAASPRWLDAYAIGR